MNDREWLKYLVKLADQFRNTPIVDDDFPAYRDRFDGALVDAKRFLAEERPIVVCLCGSTRFAEAYSLAMRDETLAGRIVLTVGLLGHHEGLDMNGPVKATLDTLHLRKIDRSDEILVLNIGGYLGSSTIGEIKYAIRHGKHVRFLEPVPDIGTAIEAAERKLSNMHSVS